jgi:hypothetical protein
MKFPTGLDNHRHDWSKQLVQSVMLERQVATLHLEDEYCSPELVMGTSRFSSGLRL